jgi:fatty-acyl-CoA synthase
VRAPSHNASHWLARRALLSGTRLAVVDGPRRLDYAALEERCARTAGLLRAAGVGPGERVALWLDNRSTTLELVFAAARIGAIAVPLHARLAPPEIAELLGDCRPRLLVHEERLAEGAERACAATRQAPPMRLATGGTPDAYEDALASAPAVHEIAAATGEEPMILMYTSGTTGAPKGALLPHRKTLFNSLNAQLFFDLTRRDRVLVAVPLYHSFGLKILSIPTLYAGGTVVLARRFDPEDVWRTVSEERITLLGGVPTMFQALEDALVEAPAGRFDLRSLRLLFTAGAPIPVELIHAFQARGLPLQQGFGQTETSILCCLDAEDAVRKAGSVGRPVFHAELRIVRTESLAAPPAAWQDCAPGETGEIVVRGPIVMLGYWERLEASAETLRDGWLRTGDLGSFDPEGFVTLTGRARELFISGGENVYPRQVEGVYETHPQVREIAVAGVPDATYGEVGRAWVVLAEGALLDEEALRTWGRERLAAFKVPRRFVAVKELPRTETGKVQKFRLVEAARGLAT